MMRYLLTVVFLSIFAGLLFWPPTNGPAIFLIQLIGGFFIGRGIAIFSERLAEKL